MAGIALVDKVPFAEYKLKEGKNVIT